MTTTTVTRNYQITLPKDVREIGNIHICDKIIVDMKDNVIELRKFSKEQMRSCFGAWKTKEDSVKFVRKIRDEEERRLKRLGL